MSKSLLHSNNLFLSEKGSGKTVTVYIHILLFIYKIIESNKMKR
jgi:hypothetical protein